MMLVIDPVKLLEEYIRADLVGITNIIYAGRDKKDVDIKPKDKIIIINKIKTKVRDYTVIIQGISPSFLSKERDELENKLRIFAHNKSHSIDRIKIEIDKPILKIEFTLVDN